MPNKCMYAGKTTQVVGYIVVIWSNALWKYFHSNVRGSRSVTERYHFARSEDETSNRTPCQLCLSDSCKKTTSCSMHNRRKSCQGI